MSREQIDFNKLGKVEQESFIAETWCDYCRKPDLGIKNPAYYKEDGRKFVEGNCLICDSVCRTRIIEKKINEM
jgi:hypothetical protein